MSALNQKTSSSADAERSATRVSEGGYPATSWTVVRAAGGADPARAQAALLTLAERYRGPVRAYLTCEGYSDDEADALAERFFVELGGTSALRSATEGNEPFRVWLIRALEQFLSADPDPTRPPPPGPASKSERNDPPKVPGYDIIESLGVGGEGTVYRAHDSRAQRQVALKILHPRHLHEPEVVERFRRSVALASTLDHPNIVRVYDKGGPNDEHPYYAMQLVVGGTLAERQRQEHFRDPERAARLVIKIARALHHAHQRGILHRDVSPANVLLDSNDEPFVSDFLAKRIQSGPSTAVGKFAYSAPELAEGNGGTVEADVYGLGAILYELWTGSAPIKADSFDEVRQQHERGGPKPARSLVPKIPRDLDIVCRTAMSRDPKERHASAAVFADSLERALAKFPPLWPKVSRWRRIWLWVCRHPLLAVGALLGAFLLLTADWLTLASVREQQAELELATLHGNAALASAQARAVLSLFEKLGSEAQRTAAEPEVREFLEQGQIGTMSALRRAFERRRSLDSVSVFSRDGRILARYPAELPQLLGREFRFREYFQCIDALATRAGQSELDGRELGVCLSPAYRGEIAAQIGFSVAAPVYTSAGVIGFVAMNKRANNTLEEIEIDDVYQSGQTTALFGVRGRDRSSPSRNESLPKQLTLFAHPGLFRNEERALDLELSRKLLQHFGAPSPPGGQLRPLRVRPWEEADYIDPVTQDRRLAGFAPVGATGFVVSVSTPRSKALGASERHIEALWRYAAMLNFGFLLLGGVALWGSLRDVPPGSRR